MKSLFICFNSSNSSWSMKYFNLTNLIANNNRVMKIILGSTFDIKDIVCYVIGYIIIVLTENGDTICYTNYLWVLSS